MDVTIRISEIDGASMAPVIINYRITDDKILISDRVKLSRTSISNANSQSTVMDYMRDVELSMVYREMTYEEASNDSNINKSEAFLQYKLTKLIQ